MVTVDEIIERLNKTRFRPASESEDAFGELRSLAHHEFMGGELWSDWEALIDALPVERGEEAIRYLAQVWGLPPDASSREDVEDEFLSRALVPLVRCGREEGILEDLDFAVAESDIAYWEREVAPIPSSFRRFLTECSGGWETQFESEFFCFSRGSGFQMLREFMVDSFSREELDVDLPEAEVEAERESAFCNGLAALTASPTSIIRVNEVQDTLWDDVLAQYPDDPASSMIVLNSFFEGNHGDDVTALCLAGPLRGKLIMWDSFIHSAGFGGRMLVCKKLTAAWLTEIIMDWDDTTEW